MRKKRFIKALFEHGQGRDRLEEMADDGKEMLGSKLEGMADDGKAMLGKLRIR